MTSKPRILLIDENPADRPLAAVVLSSAAARPVCEVGDSTNLISALKDGAYDVVVTEIGIDGASSRFQIEAICAIQKAVPVIVFTHEDDPESRRKALAAGAVAFVRKSTQGFLDLADALRDALGESPDEGATQAPAASPVATELPVEPPAFALDPLPPREPAAPNELAWRDRLSPAIAKVRTSLDHGVGRGVAIFFGVIAVSALLSALFGSFGQDDAVAQDSATPSGVVLSATADENSAASEVPAPPQPLAPATDATEEAGNVAAPATEGRVAPSDAPVTLELQATDDVWVNARVDGVEAFDLILTAGQTRSLTAQQHVELRIGNADGLAVTWNGKDIGRLGRPDQVRRLHFTPTSVGPGPPPGE